MIFSLLQYLFIKIGFLSWHSLPSPNIRGEGEFSFVQGRDSREIMRETSFDDISFRIVEEAMRRNASGGAGRKSDIFAENNDGVCRLWRMGAIRAASTRCFSADLFWEIGSGRISPRR